MIPTVCPECGNDLELLEWGSYSGSRQLDENGHIDTESYREHWSDVHGFSLSCTNYDCDYEFFDFIIDDVRLIPCN